VHIFFGDLDDVGRDEGYSLACQRLAGGRDPVEFHELKGATHGYDDLFLGAEFDQDGPETGAAYLIRGPVAGDFDVADAHGRLEAEEGFGRAGYSVGAAGDVDGDGTRDLMVGAVGFLDTETFDPADRGAAYLVLGPVTGTHSLSEAAARFQGEVDGDAAGTSVAGDGDLDGDGAPDLLVAAGYESTAAPDAGAVYVLYTGAWGEPPR
jgi:hypothetical protein